MQREVESPRCSDSDKRAPGEGLEAYALGIDATVVIGCGEDAKIYEEISTSTDQRWVRGKGVELRSLHDFLMLWRSMSQEQQWSELLGLW